MKTGGLQNTLQPSRLFKPETEPIGQTDLGIESPSLTAAAAGDRGHEAIDFADDVSNLIQLILNGGQAIVAVFQ
jgi:hypothetical protein